ncbi:uncharacterized protein LOC135805155 [Sycon ciliatum]|uniref:uncharacterized protein LOC135805155 n=1 Tax=Sycon ciliatum TaxID=27933 RepID=UPI0031F6D0C6
MFYRTAPAGEKALAELEEICCRRLVKLQKSFNSSCRVTKSSASSCAQGTENSQEQDDNQNGEEQSDESEDDDGEDGSGGEGGGSLKYELHANVVGTGKALRTKADYRATVMTPRLLEDDLIGHFTLRLALSGRYSCWKTWVYAEASLFAERLAAMNTDEVSNVLRDNRDAIPALSLLPVDSAAMFLISWRYTNQDDRESFLAPFFSVPELVATRSVEICDGKARVKCTYLGQLLQNAFFEEVWNSRVGCHSAYAIAVNDPRLRQLFLHLQDTVRRRFIGDRHHRSSSESGELAGSMGGVTRAPLHPSLVDGLSAFFPPCMRHMHRTLRKRHRLDHHARVQYSLYLKRIGLGAEDALQFWREEYSKTPACCHGKTTGCTHSWHTDGRRYTYNIRHLYGLEGSRRNYSCFSCQHMIEESGSASGAGGCPFRYFDQHHLSNLLRLYDLPHSDVSSVVSGAATAGGEMASCRQLLQLTWQQHSSSHAPRPPAPPTATTNVSTAATAVHSRHGCCDDDVEAKVPSRSKVEVAMASDDNSLSPPGDLVLAVDTDSEDDDSFLSRLSARPSEVALSAASSSTCMHPPGVDQSGTTPAAANRDLKVLPALVAASVRIADQQKTEILEKFHSPVDFYTEFRMRIDTCSDCRTSHSAT